ncbi:MAG TPA: metalloregulator ArsR/SmtB family transcription factor [Fimbriimonadaceae bacterium]|nr:metalloregulator ArsR/SmtB family transcription factor [Fimbriimonadaceae bacterium]
MDQLSLVFGALSDPTRRAILARLAQGETTVAELAKPFSISLPAISKHLKVLEAAGLLKQRVVAQTRPCRVEGEPLKRAAEYVEAFRPFWDERFDRLAGYLEHLRSEDQAHE